MNNYIWLHLNLHAKCTLTRDYQKVRTLFNKIKTPEGKSTKISTFLEHLFLGYITNFNKSSTFL